MSGGWLNVARCSLYFFVALLTPVSAVISDAATQGAWPLASQIVAAFLAGTVAGLVAIRAYLDGSNERWIQERNGGKAQ